MVKYWCYQPAQLLIIDSMSKFYGRCALANLKKLVIITCKDIILPKIYSLSSLTIYLDDSDPEHLIDLGSGLVSKLSDVVPNLEKLNIHKCTGVPLNGLNKLKQLRFSSFTGAFTNILDRIMINSIDRQNYFYEDRSSNQDSRLQTKILIVEEVALDNRNFWPNITCNELMIKPLMHNNDILPGTYIRVRNSHNNILNKKDFGTIAAFVHRKRHAGCNLNEFKTDSEYIIDVVVDIDPHLNFKPFSKKK